MRFSRIDLIRYGHFTDQSILLPLGSNHERNDGSNDFHILYGHNEDGKSTTKTAIEDLLFGIPERTPYGFLHGYGSLRLGAEIQHRGQTQTVHRCKGRKNTLQDPDSAPISEQVLTWFMGNAGREFFERMFSLDQHRLQTGGQEILEARDEIGQMLFSAGTGIADLHQRLSVLEAKADLCWTARKTPKPAYYKAQARIDAAQKKLRETLLTANQWRKLQEEFEKAEKNRQKKEETCQTTFSNLQKLQRIIKNYRDIQDKKRLDAEIKQLGSVVLLPENAQQIFDEVLAIESQANAKTQTLLKNLEQAESRLKEVSCDESILSRVTEIEALRGRSETYANAKRDLPLRQNELKQEEGEITAYARELNWEVQDIAAIFQRLPTSITLNAVQQSLEEVSGLETTLQTHERNRRNTVTKIARLRREREKLPEPKDVKRLESKLSGLEQRISLFSEMTTQTQDTERLGKKLDMALNAFPQWTGSVETLKNLPVPSKLKVVEFQKKYTGLENRRQKNEEDLSSHQERLEQQEKTRERLIRREDPVMPEQLRESRAHRQKGWDLVRRKFVANEDVAPEEIRAFVNDTEPSKLIAVYEKTIESADTLADRRFNEADATARLAQCSEEIEQIQLRIKQLSDHKTQIENDFRMFDSAWRELWTNAGITPALPDEMLQWLAQREAVLLIQQELELSDQCLENLHEESRQFHEYICQAAEQAGFPIEDLIALELTQLRHQALDFCKTEQQRSEQRISLQKQFKEAANDLIAVRHDLKTANANFVSWEKRWRKQVEATGLDPQSSRAGIRDQLDMIKKLPLLKKSRNELLGRIRDIDQCIRDFERDTTSLAEDIAPDMASFSEQKIVDMLVQHLQAAQKIKTRQETEAQQIEDYQKQIRELNESISLAQTRLAPLEEASGIKENREALKTAICQSDQSRQWTSKREQIIDRLRRQGDGLSLEDLEFECAGVDYDQVSAEKHVLETDVQQCLNDLKEAIASHTEAKKALELTDDNMAAEAATEKRVGLADMQNAAEQYICLKTQALLLRWGIDQYRQKMQAPLLKRAGEVFSAITLNAFSRLEVDYDENRLIGVRPNEERVPVQGMSRGTENQLYLALRIAAVEEYLIKGHALPFIADDLFITFDNARTAAGLKILSELAERTQVIFFTHEEHIPEIAKSELGEHVNITKLPNRSSFLYNRRSEAFALQ